MMINKRWNGTKKNSCHLLLLGESCNAIVDLVDTRVLSSAHLQYIYVQRMVLLTEAMWRWSSRIRDSVASRCKDAHA